jgi:endonuclease/exonuclease/phosphatase family metal-dependent hydrolase
MWFKNILFGIALIFIVSGCHKTQEPPSPEPSVDFDACISSGNQSSFEIVTLNLEGFPKEGYQTIIVIRDLINRINPDVIALQEVASESDFNTLVGKLNGWDGRFYPINNDLWNLAYLFKTSEVSIDDTKTKLLFTGDSYAFPRPPFEIFVTHKSLGISTYLINIHLKCCSGTENEDRRRDASEKLDEYINSTLPSDPVIVLGDYNDEISGDTYESNVFYNLVSAPSEYMFTDMAIAKGSLLWWSYPSYPSHIDHIMVTDELFSEIDTVMVLKPEPCYSSWSEMISDHRPVELIMK